MKKAVIILSIIAAALSLTGCEIDGAMIRTEEYIIKPTDWIVTNDCLYVECNADVLTRSAIDNGIVSACYYIDEERTWAPLPFIRTVTYSSGMSTTTTVESIRAEWSEGLVVFIVEDMDGRVPLLFDRDKRFKVSVSR